MSDYREKGVVLAVTLLVLVVVGTLGVVISMRSVQEGRLVLQQSAQTKAFWITEGGIQKAYWDMTNNNCQSMRNQNTGAVCADCNCSGSDKVMSGNINGGTYSVIVNAAGTQMTSSGSYALNANNATVLRQIQTNLSAQSVFGYAAFAAGSMTFANNALVDSYNSLTGAYGGINIGVQGNIGTNGSTANIISLSNNVNIQGSVSTGSGGTVQVGSNVTIAGATTHANNVTLSPVAIPPDLTSLPLSRTFNIPGNGRIFYMNAGDYKFDRIALNNNDELRITSDVRLYLTGNPAMITGNNCMVTINNGASLKIYTDGAINFNNNVRINNLGRNPSKFMIFSTYAGSNGIGITNNSVVYGAIYAPQTDVDISNNGDVFGAIVGATVDISNNGEVHYDTALGSISSSGSPVVVRDWQEI